MNEYSKKMLVGAIVPIVVFFLAAFNNYLAQKGAPIIEIGDQALSEQISRILEYLAALWCWWKNNNVTKKSQMAQEYLNELRDE